MQLRDILTSPGFLTAVVSLIAFVASGMIAMVWLRRWLRKQSEETWGKEGHLEQFRKLYQQGDLTREEYQQICRTLAKQDQPISDEEKRVD